MRIVHISTYTSEGGAAKAAYRIHSRLLDNGVESDMLVLKNSSHDLKRVTKLPETLSYRIKDYFFLRLDKFLFGRYLKRNSLPFSFNFFPRVSIHSHPLIQKADIVCLYWIGANFLTPRQIAKLKKPVIWRFSDKWAITGNCHLSGTCKRYEQHCGNCPQLITDKKKDFTWYAWKRKFSAWKEKKMTIVVPSSWMEDAVHHSPIFNNKPVVRIPTGVDHNIFRPLDKEIVRQKLSIITGKKIILYGANNPFKTLYKGSEFFIEMINKLSKDDYQFIVFGSTPDNSSQVSIENITFLGDIKKEKDLALIYNAADIFISPSTEDNLPNTVLEAMSCGTPCIAFQNSGGVVDVIEHKVNGYLAEYKNPDDLINGINWLFENNNFSAVARKARERIIESFTLDNQVKSYLNLYDKLLKSK